MKTALPCFSRCFERVQREVGYGQRTKATHIKTAKAIARNLNSPRSTLISPLSTAICGPACATHVRRKLRGCTNDRQLLRQHPQRARHRSASRRNGDTEEIKPAVPRKNLMVLSFRRLFMLPLFPVDTRDADHSGQSSLQLVGHTEFGDVKFPAPELHGHPSGTFAILDGPCWRAHARPLRPRSKATCGFAKKWQKKGVSTASGASANPCFRCPTPGIFWWITGWAMRIGRWARDTRSN